jgi:putative endonuclease
MFFVYIIQSLRDKSFYIGYTSDLKKRLELHNIGKSKYTSKKIPWKLVYFEEFLDKTEAIKREKFLKLQRNKDFYIKLIENFKEP